MRIRAGRLTGVFMIALWLPCHEARGQTISASPGIVVYLEDYANVPGYVLQPAQAQFIEHPPPAEALGAMTPLLAWMEQNLSRELPLPVIARRAAMSTRTLSRRFREQVGATPWPSSKWPPRLASGPPP